MAIGKFGRVNGSFINMIYSHPNKSALPNDCGLESSFVSVIKKEFQDIQRLLANGIAPRAKPVRRGCRRTFFKKSPSEQGRARTSPSSSKSVERTSLRMDFTDQDDEEAERRITGFYKSLTYEEYEGRRGMIGTELGQRAWWSTSYINGIDRHLTQDPFKLHEEVLSFRSLFGDFRGSDRNWTFERGFGTDGADRCSDEDFAPDEIDSGIFVDRYASETRKEKNVREAKALMEEIRHFQVTELGKRVKGLAVRAGKRVDKAIQQPALN